MIRRIYSSLPKFKGLTFHPGLNILLADTTPEATERQTRNRAGKSSLTEVMHFLLGSSVDNDSIFRDAQLQEHSFGMEFDLASQSVTVERVPANAGVLELKSGESSHWPDQPNTDPQTGQALIRNSIWKDVLGRLLFGLPESTEKFGPSFRSLLSYFIRRQSSKGFLDPFRQSEDQQLFDQQVALSYLVGLDWQIPQQWQVVREREKSLKVLKKAAKEGALGEVVPSTADLRTRLTVLEAHTAELRQNLGAFRVLAEYRELEAEASALTRKISGYLDENTIDRQLLDDLETSLEEENPPRNLRLEEVYKEAGIVLPGVALKRFEDVRAFHESVIANRHSYLEGEIGAARHRIDQRERAVHGLEDRRSEIMLLLQSHGALDHFNRIQSELTRGEHEVQSLRERYRMAEALETGKTELALERQQLLLRLRQDHREQEATWREAILTFEEISRSLYEDAGSLHISESENGPAFEVKIHGKRSQGINSMQIFCFDMMLLKLCAKRGRGPGFLVHDSHLFDGVDTRQVATALSVGANTAAALGSQYIVTMNSDVVPQKFPDGFDLERHILPVRLTDATEDGGLFGLRFG
ncbi:MAG: DUF2326 domain-containing protein [Thermoanaerobaculia bacterium]|nr:DUF2326 domain-containing protein [Thermoanaerobaculia bacterium]